MYNDPKPFKVPADQSNPHVRTVSEVNRRGQEVLEAYSDSELGGYGIIDATKAPYQADPTGERDSTSAIQRAIDDARDARCVTFLPGGTYKVSDTITGLQGIVSWENWPYSDYSDPWSSHASFEYPCVLYGSAENPRTVLRLIDNAAGFDNPDRPKPLLHFWSRMGYGDGAVSGPQTHLRYGNVDTSKPQRNINYNQKIVNIDIDLGEGNPGAVGIDHQGTVNSVTEDVTIHATGAFAGLWGGLGSGGAVHGVKVIGGRYGFYFVRDNPFGGAQPSPVVSAITLQGQTEQAILCDGRGPLTVVGALIEGAGIRSQSSKESTAHGALNIIDTVLRMKTDQAAIYSNHSIVAQNVYISGAKEAVRIQEQFVLPGAPDGWLHIEECAAGAENLTPGMIGGDPRRDTIWIERDQQDKPVVVTDDRAPEDEQAMIARHDWERPCPAWSSPGSVNAKKAPYLAKGDGVTDDSGAIQRALDENEVVWLPKGTYALGKPLTLHAKNKLIGLGTVQTVLTVTETGAAYNDVLNPQPLVDTDDDADASTMLQYMKLLVPVRNPCVYALRWRAGRNSVVRNVYAIREFWHPQGIVMDHPMMLIEGNGGGRWFTIPHHHWWDQGHDYRHLKVSGTREPLQFYMLEPQFAHGEAMVEFNDARNIDIFSIKAECNYTVLWMRNCSNVRFFGFAGFTMPRPGLPVIRIEDCSKITLANIHPSMRGFGHWGSLGIGFDPKLSYVLKDTHDGKTTAIGTTEQFAYYKTDD